MIGMLRRMVAVLIASVVVVGLSADPGADGTTAGDPARLFAENPGARLPGDEGFLLRDLNRLALEWNRATLAGAYSTHGERDPERHEAALTLLELLAQHFSAKLPGASAEELTQAALPLRDTDGFVQRDPILCYAISATVSLAKAGEPDELKYLDRAIEGFRERPEYPRSRAWIAADRAVEVLRRVADPSPEDERKRKEMQDLAIQWCAEGAAEEIVTAGGQRVYWPGMVSALWRGFAGRELDLHEALANQEGTDPWLVAMAGGCAHTRVGWKARGGDFAYAVTEEGWEAFGEHLSQARDYLEEADQLHPEFPEAAACMITIEMADPRMAGKSPRYWFDRATAAQFDHGDAYTRYLRVLWPRWGGSIDEMLAFGVECLDSGRFDTNVPRMCLEAVLECAFGEGAVEVWDEPGTWDSLVRMCEGMLADPAHAWEEASLKTIYAAAAWRTGHYDVARRHLEELGEDAVTPTFHREFSCIFPRAEAEIYAATGEHGATVRAAKALYRAGDVQGALTVLEGIPLGAADEHTTTHVLHRLTACSVEVGLAEGGWVSLTPDSLLAMAERKGPPWVVENGTLGVEPSTGWRSLTSHADVGQRYEARLDVEYGALGTTAFGLGLNLSPGRPPRSAYASVTGKGTARLSQATERGLAVEPTSTIVVQVWDSRANLEIDGERVFTRAYIGGEGRGRLPNHIALMMLNDILDGNTTAWLWEAEIRRLTVCPEGLEPDGPPAP